MRVIDLFREWDDDNNGKVSRAEFHKAMGEMKFEAPPEEIDKLFDEWDPDGSGVLELNELSKLLRRGSTVKLDEKLQAGAVEVDMEKGTKIAIRKGKLDRTNSVLLQGFDIDESSDKTVAEQVCPPARALHSFRLELPSRYAVENRARQELRAHHRPFPPMGRRRQRTYNSR